MLMPAVFGEVLMRVYTCQAKYDDLRLTLFLLLTQMTDTSALSKQGIVRSSNQCQMLSCKHHKPTEICPYQQLHLLPPKCHHAMLALVRLLRCHLSAITTLQPYL